MRIMVTNDDGIDSVGLHVLARAMKELGDVVIVAPDREYSGFGCALGSVHLIRPEVHKSHVEGIDEAWSVSGPPALCSMFGRLGAFGGDPIDLVVAGINPGANVGRSVYYSGTVGACLSARNGGVTGVAVSQAVDSWGVLGQGWDDVLDKQLWDSAATVAQHAVRGLLSKPPTEPSVLNINVPNLPIEQIKGWKRCEIGTVPPRTMGAVRLEPKAGHEGSFNVAMDWGKEAKEIPVETDSGAVMNGYVSVSWLTKLDSDDRETTSAEEALGVLF